VHPGHHQLLLWNLEPSLITSSSRRLLGPRPFEHLQTAKSAKFSIPVQDLRSYMTVFFHILSFSGFPFISLCLMMLPSKVAHIELNKSSQPQPLMECLTKLLTFTKTSTILPRQGHYFPGSFLVGLILQYVVYLSMGSDQFLPTAQFCFQTIISPLSWFC
jgi:hypothetical protein